MPADVTYRDDIFVALPADEPSGPDAPGVTTFLRFPGDAAAAIRAAQLDGFVARHPDPAFAPAMRRNLTHAFTPLGRVHLARPSDRAIVTALGIVGMLALFVAIVNAAGGTTPAITYAGTGTVLPTIGLLIVVVGLLAGLYPALFLSRFQPAAILASVRSPGGARSGARLRAALVVGQFSAAIALMITTAVLLAQARHLQRSDLGFRRDALVMVPSFKDVALDVAQREAPAAAAAVSQASLAPANASSFWIGGMRAPGADTPDVQLIQGDVGPGFFATYGAKLLAGRVFDAAYTLDEASDDPGRAQNLILNRTAISRLGFASPDEAVGRTIRLDGARDATIVGVVEDMRFRSPRDPVDPHAYHQRTRDLGGPVLALRVTGKARPVIDRLAMAWRRVAPAVPYAAMTVERSLYGDFYRADAQRSRLFLIGAVLAVAIGCIGLYGLAAFDTARRVREIDIRQTLGGSTRNILTLLIGQYMRPVFVANAVCFSPVSPFFWRRRTRLRPAAFPQSGVAPSNFRQFGSEAIVRRR